MDGPDPRSNSHESAIKPSWPACKMHFPAPRGDSLARLLKLVQQKTTKAVLDPGSPFLFTTEGVRAAFNLMIARGAQGKVVIAVRDGW